MLHAKEPGTKEDVLNSPTTLRTGYHIMEDREEYVWNRGDSIGKLFSLLYPVIN
jgi:hypothetical protein